MQELREGGFDSKEIRVAEVTFQQLHDGGYSAKEARDGGYAAEQLATRQWKQ